MNKRYMMIILCSLFIFILTVDNAYGEISLNNSNSSNGGGNTDIEQIGSTDFNYFFGLDPFDREAIATYGKLPKLEIGEQKQNWSLKLKELGIALDNELYLDHMYPNGKVLTTGENSRGYFVVVFYKNLTIEEQLIGEIYTIIEENAKNMGIHEVPVKFEGGIYQMNVIDGRSESEKRADEEYDKSGGNIYKPEIIATYGKLPELKTEEQRWNWLHENQRAIIGGLIIKIDPYLYPSGPLTGFGAHADGYFEATVLRNMTTGKPLLDEIYGMIDTEAKNVGIQEVPVRFIVVDDLPRPDVEILDETSDKSLPAFGLLGSLISLLAGWGLVKRA